jgi:hypothetical protein
VGRRRQGREVGQATQGWVAQGQELRCRSGSVGVERVARGRLGGRGRRARGWSFGHAESVGLLGPSDESPIHKNSGALYIYI